MSGQPGYIPKNVLKNRDSQTIPANTTEQLVSEEFKVSYPDSINFVSHFKISGVTLGSEETITVKLQQHIGESEWADVGDEACFYVDEGDGHYSMLLTIGNSLESLVLPLSTLCRFVVTTGATSTLTIDRIYFYNKI